MEPVNVINYLEDFVYKDGSKINNFDSFANDDITQNKKSDLFFVEGWTTLRELLQEIEEDILEYVDKSIALDGEYIEYIES